MGTIEQSKLLVILGQTATGKSDLAIQVAKQYDGEIICADSRTVYRGMDIGTAMPSKVERAAIPHHLLGIVNPNQQFSVADFKNMAVTAINDIAKRGKLPILVGGSGLYVDSVLYDYQFRSSANGIVVDGMTVEQMQQKVLDMGLKLPENNNNPRYLQRIIESGQNSPENKQLRPKTLIIGLCLEGEDLSARVKQRTEKMLELGLIDEIITMTSKYGWDCYAFQTPAYYGFRSYLEGSINQQQAIDLVASADMKLAKKQLTWFKRNKSIHWLNDPSKYVASTTTLVNNFIRKQS